MLAVKALPSAAFTLSLSRRCLPLCIHSVAVKALPSAVHSLCRCQGAALRYIHSLCSRSLSWVAGFPCGRVCIPAHLRA